MRHVLGNYWPDVIFRLSRLLLGGVFVYAALLKICAPQEFADAIASFQLVPYPLINITALGLPLFELICGLLLLTGYFCGAGLLSITGMLLVFLMALGSAILRGHVVDCGCFGGRFWLDGGPWISFPRDIVLLICSVCTYWNYNSGPGQMSDHNRAVGASELPSSAE